MRLTKNLLIAAMVLVGVVVLVAIAYLVHGSFEANATEEQQGKIRLVMSLAIVCSIAVEAVLWFLIRYVNRREQPYGAIGSDTEPHSIKRPPHIPAEAVIVSRESFESDDPCEIIESNISFLNALFAEHLEAHEVSQDGLRSYYVDYFLAQMENGGFSQFVYNSRWNHQVIKHVREGLAAMGAHAHLKLLELAGQTLDELGPERLEQFFASEYFGENAERDFLSRYDDKFFALLKHEDLRKLNATWLRRLSNLVVVPRAQIEQEVQGRATALPDRESRIASALENEPRYKKLIRALCRLAGQELSQVTAGDPTHEHEGRPTLAWHFITDQGHHYMVEDNGTALMFRGDLNSLVAKVEAAEDEYGKN